MSRPYLNFQIDQLELEFERAQRESDPNALGQLRDELTLRRPSPRVNRLLQRLAQHAPTPPRPPTPPAPPSPLPPSPPRPPRGFRPTPEQEQAIEAFRTGESLKINAYAGSGKTSTLALLAHSTPRQGQYLAFNKKIVEDSRGRFPRAVDTRTTHSLAFRSLSGTYSKDKLMGKILPNHLVQILNLQGWRIDRDHVLRPRSQAFLILSTIRRFCQSAAPSLLPEHVPRHGSLAAASAEILREVTAVTLNGAQHVWSRMLSMGDPLPLGHDGYLKAWALSDPLLSVNYILLDEAQDTNPVVLGVLEKQRAQIVYVGDQFQQIYEWRGAVNAMERVNTVHHTSLTLSFRFGGQVAWAANRVLEMLKADKPLTGNAQRDSRIAGAPDGTVLARTNATTMTAIIEALDAGRRPHLVGGTAELMGMLEGVVDLKAGRPSSVPEFFGFENWQQLLEFVRSGEGDELLTFVNLVEARGERQLLWALNRVVDEDKCDFIVSTAHKAKGREWDHIRLTDDFLKTFPRKEQQGQLASGMDPSELRLLYVALTRAKEILELPPSLMEFLNTGRLPPQAEVPRAPGPPRANAGLPGISASTPPPPRWEPPKNWSPAPERPGGGRQNPVAPPTPARPTPSPPQDPGQPSSLLARARRWLTGQ